MLVESITAKHHLVVKVQVVQIVVKNLPLIDWVHDVYQKKKEEQEKKKLSFVRNWQCWIRRRRRKTGKLNKTRNRVGQGEGDIFMKIKIGNMLVLGHDQRSNKGSLLKKNITC
jgi:hypothetical protein